MDNLVNRKINYRFIDTEKNITIANISHCYPSTLLIECAGLPSLNKALIKIFNLKSSVMSNLSFLSFRTLNLPRISIECLVENKTVFKGDVTSSIPIYDIPNPYLQITAMTDYWALIKPSKDILFEIPDGKDYIEISIKDVVDEIFEDVKKNKNISYYNVNNVKILNPRFVGSKIQQLEKIIEEGKVNIIDNYDSIKVILKGNKSYTEIIEVNGNSNKIVKQISNDDRGINFMMLFDNNIELQKKLKITKNEINPQANGEFVIYEVEHSLSCNIPNGDFFTKVKAVLEE